MAPSFTNSLEMSSQCLCVFTLRFCVSQSRLERVSRALCLYCLFPAGRFGTLRGKRHCSHRPIKYKQRTMEDGRRRISSTDTAVESLPRCHLGTKVTGYNVKVFSNCSTQIHTHSEEEHQIIPSVSALRLYLNELCPFRVNYSH